MKPNQSIKAYNPKEIERKWVDSISISRDFDYSKKVFSLAIPPPNVTGSLHLGHALNSTVQDVLVKYYYLKGFNVQWTPGTDHAGIATQLLVEKSLSKKGLNLKELSNDELIEEIWKWKEINGDQIINQLRTLGLSCDWDEKKFKYYSPPLSKHDFPNAGAFTQSIFIPDTKQAVTATKEGNIVLWDCSLIGVSENFGRPSDRKAVKMLTMGKGGIYYMKALDEYFVFS